MHYGCNLDSADLNLGAKILVTSLLTAVPIFMRRRVVNVNFVYFSLYIFLLLYGFRIFYDALILDRVPPFQTSYKLIAYFVGMVVVPVVLVTLFPQLVNVRSWVSTFTCYLVIANLILLLFALLDADFVLMSLLGGRMQVVGEDPETSVLSPLTYGSCGAMLILAVVAQSFYQKHGDAPSFFFIFLLFLLGLSNLLISASRGPMVSMLISVIVFLSTRQFRSRSLTKTYSFQMSYSIRIYTFVVILLSVGGWIMYSLKDELFIVARLMDFSIAGIGAGSEERELIYLAALHDFAQSPLFGSSYIVSYMNAEPHNIVLEVLISTGVVGVLVITPFFMMVGAGIYRSFVWGTSSYHFVTPILALYSIFFGMTSLSLAQSPEIWIFCSLAIITGKDASACRHQPFLSQ